MRKKRQSSDLPNLPGLSVPQERKISNSTSRSELPDNQPEENTRMELRIPSLKKSVEFKRTKDQEIFIPIHDFVWLSQKEIKIINHPAFQRLGHMMQLGFAYNIYRGATHKRFEHVLGTLAVAKKIIRAIKNNHSHEPPYTQALKKAPRDNPLSKVEETFVRMAALLHDIGHIAAGHTLEDELGLLRQHDSVDRLDAILDRESWFGIKCTPLREVIDDQYKGVLRSNQISASEVLLQIIAKNPKEIDEERLGIRLNVCRDIVQNTICADILDYLYRDWYHIGKLKHFESRLLQYMEIRKDPIDGKPKFIISLGQFPNLRTDAISAILELLESRYRLCESVLFHPTKCAASACLERSIMEIYLNDTKAAKRDHAAWSIEVENDLFDFSDIEMLKYFYSKALKQKNLSAMKPLEALLHRQVYKEISTEYGDTLLQEQMEFIQLLYTKKDDALVNRIQAVQKIEKDFGLPPGTIVIYCPRTEMNAKIPDVNICVGGSIKRFVEWDTPAMSSRKRFAAGHIEAQLIRFSSLWRVHFFIQRDIYLSLSSDLRQLICKVIKINILNNIGLEEDLDEAVFEIAKRLSELPDNPLSGKKTLLKRVAARKDPSAGELYYPTGAPTLRSFIQGAHD